jgi:tetratricopeptide (TPR) repeat protein
VFSEPGQYFVRLALLTGYHSNTIKIYVNEPKDKVDKDGLELMKQVTVLKAASLWSGQNPTDGSEKLRRLSDGDSTYARYAAYFLARKTKDDAEALALLDKADSKGFTLQSDVVYRKGERLLKLNENQKAVDQFERIMRDFPNSAAATKLSRLKQRSRMKLTREEAKQQEEKVAERKARAEQVAQAQQAFENSGERPKVEASVRRFIAAHTAGRIEECGAMMTEDFLRGGSMDKAKTLAKMRKDFEKLKGQPLTAEPSIDSITSDGTDVVVVATVVYRYQGQSATQKESYTLRQEDNQWKVRRMDIISTPEPR